MLTRRYLACLLLASMLNFVAVPASGQDLASTERTAIAMIERFGGTYERDVTRPGQPIVQVFLGVSVKLRDHHLRELADLTELRSLNLIGTRITDKGLAHLDNLTRLEEVVLEDTRISDAGLICFLHGKQLRSLNICHCVLLTDLGIQGLAGQRKLERLDLAHTATTNVGLYVVAGLDSLTSLELLRTPINEYGVLPLVRLKHLTFLDVRSIRIAQRNLNILREHLPECDIFDGNDRPDPEED